MRSGDEATLGNQILQEGASSPADVFYTENTPVLEALREHGLLAPVAPSTLAAVPAAATTRAQGDWVGVSARVSVLVYNTAQARAREAAEHRSCELAEPRWKGKLGFAPSETDFQPLITSVIKLDGAAAAERWLKGLQANGTVYPDNETVVDTGQQRRERARPDQPLLLVPPARGGRRRRRCTRPCTTTHPATRATSSTSPAPRCCARARTQAAAQRFLAFLVSRAGQEAIAHSSSYEYPLRPGVSPRPDCGRSTSCTPRR